MALSLVEKIVQPFLALTDFVIPWYGWLLLFVIIYGLYPYITDWAYNLPPGPFPLPYIGSFWSIIFRPKKEQIGETLSKVIHRYSDGKICTFYFGRVRTMIVNDSKSIHELLGNTSQTGSLTSGRVEPYLDGFQDLRPGIVFANGETWKRHRRFALRAMRDFGMGKEIMVHRIHDELPDVLAVFEKKASLQVPFFPRKVVSNAIVNIVSTLVTGHRYESPEDPTFVELNEYIDGLASTTTAESAAVMVIPFFKYFKSPRQVKLTTDVSDMIIGLFKKAVEEARQDFVSDNIRHLPDLFHYLERQSDAPDLDDFANITPDLYIAGAETTSTTLTWTLFLMAKYPEVQRKCQAAIDGVIESTRFPTTADRNELVYLDAVFCEVSRFVTILPLGLPHSNLEHHIKANGYDCPPWTMLMYNVYSVQHDADYWGDPEVFRPERWIDDDGKLLAHSTHFLTFGMGPRVCIGEQMGRLEHFLILTSILHRYSLRLTTRDVTVEDGKYGIVVACPYFEVIAESR